MQIAADNTAAAMTVRVVARGAGIRAEDLPHIFDRFYKGLGSRAGPLTAARS